MTQPLLTLVLLFSCTDKQDPPTTASPTPSATVSATPTATDTPFAPPTGDPATVPLNGACPLDTKQGYFLVQTTDDFAIVDGQFSDGVVPQTVLEETATDGGCKLLRRNNPFCNPACASGTTCDYDGTCIPFPAPQDLGVVEVAGLVGPVRMFPVEPSFNYFDTSLSNPPFSLDSLVELRSSGGPLGDFEMHGVGVEPLVTSGGELVVYDGQDLPVTWTPSTGLGRSNIHFKLNIDQHGNTPITLFCDLPDTGSGSIPFSLVTQLVNAGVSGFPNASLNRRTMDSSTFAGGCLEFEVSSLVTIDVRVDGFTPCLGGIPGECPAGETCNQALQICE